MFVCCLACVKGFLFLCSPSHSLQNGWHLSWWDGAEAHRPSSWPEVCSSGFQQDSNNFFLLMVCIACFPLYLSRCVAPIQFPIQVYLMSPIPPYLLCNLSCRETNHLLWLYEIESVQNRRVLSWLMWNSCYTHGIAWHMIMLLPEGPQTYIAVLDMYNSSWQCSTRCLMHVLDSESITTHTCSRYNARMGLIWQSFLL